MLGKDDMPRLLAADAVAVRAHGLEHIAVADRRHVDAPAQLCDCLVEADIRHHRRHDRLVRQTPRADHLRGAGNEDVIAVNQRARLIEAEAAVCVPVVRNADVRAALEHSAPQGLEVG